MSYQIGITRRCDRQCGVAKHGDAVMNYENKFRRNQESQFPEPS